MRGEWIVGFIIVLFSIGSILALSMAFDSRKNENITKYETDPYDVIEYRLTDGVRCYVVRQKGTINCMQVPE